MGSNVQSTEWFDRASWMWVQDGIITPLRLSGNGCPYVCVPGPDVLPCGLEFHCLLSLAGIHVRITRPHWIGIRSWGLTHSNSGKKCHCLGLMRPRAIILKHSLQTVMFRRTGSGNTIFLLKTRVNLGKSVAEWIDPDSSLIMAYYLWVSIVKPKGHGPWTRQGSDQLNCYSVGLYFPPFFFFLLLLFGSQTRATETNAFDPINMTPQNQPLALCPSLFAILPFLPYFSMLFFGGTPVSSPSSLVFFVSYFFSAPWPLTGTLAGDGEKIYALDFLSLLIRRLCVRANT